MPLAMSSGWNGSTSTTASPPTSASAPREDVTTGRPAGHGLENRHAEALVEGRQDEERGFAHQRRPVVLVDVAQEPDLALEAQPPDRPEHLFVLPALASGHDERIDVPDALAGAGRRPG